jgi:AraC family transcriptional regulator
LPALAAAATLETMTILRRGAISVIDYRCSVGPTDTPCVERHAGYSLS